MAEAREGLFRKRALERLSSPERLDQLLVVLKRRDWAILVTVLVLVAGSLTWGVLGRVPLYAEGRAVLVRPGSVVPLPARSGGVVVRFEVKVGDQVEPGATLGWLANPLLARRISDQKALLERLRAQQEALRASQAAQQTVERAGLATRRTRAERRIAGARATAESARAAIGKAVGHDRQRGVWLEEIARKHLQAALARLADIRTLHGRDAASQDEVLSAERVSLAAAVQIGDLDVRELNLSAIEAEAEQTYANALLQVLTLEDVFAELDTAQARLDAATAELTARQGFDLGGAETTLVTLELELSEASAIRSERRGRILELTVVPGDHVTTGQRLASIQLAGTESSPLVALCYFDVKGGKLVTPGMRAEITPDMVKRERFGGIVGVVEAAPTTLISTASAGSLLGDRELARAMTAEGRRIQLPATLELAPGNLSGVRWTLSGGPELTLSEGTTGDVRIRVEEVAPVALVLPALRKFLYDETPSAQ